MLLCFTVARSPLVFPWALLAALPSSTRAIPLKLTAVNDPRKPATFALNTSELIMGAGDADEKSNLPKRLRKKVCLVMGSVDSTASSAAQAGLASSGRTSTGALI